MLERSRPRVKRVAIESILANLPGMAVNPFSLFFGVRDIRRRPTREIRRMVGSICLRDIKSRNREEMMQMPHRCLRGRHQSST